MVDLIPNENPFFRVWVFYAILGAYIFLFGFFSYFLKTSLLLNEIVLATMLGILFGPFISEVIFGEPTTPEAFTLYLEATRIVIAISGTY